jgi:hypothetical protein
MSLLVDDPIYLKFWRLVELDDGPHIFGMRDAELARITSRLKYLDPSSPPTWAVTSSGRRYILGEQNDLTVEWELAKARMSFGGAI